MAVKEVAAAVAEATHHPALSAVAVAVAAVEASHRLSLLVAAAVAEATLRPDPLAAEVAVENTLHPDPSEVAAVIPGMGAFMVGVEETATPHSEHTTHHPSEAIPRPTEDRTCHLPNRVLNQGIRTGRDHGNLRTDRRKGRTLIPHEIIRTWETDKSARAETTISSRTQGPIFNAEE